MILNNKMIKNKNNIIKVIHRPKSENILIYQNKIKISTIHTYLESLLIYL